MHQRTLFLLGSLCLISSLAFFTVRVYTVRDLSNFQWRGPLLNFSELLFAVSLLFAAFWSLVAHARVPLYLWGSMVVLSVAYYAVEFFILTEWMPYLGSHGVQYLNFRCVSYPLFIGTAAHLLHLLLEDKLKNKA